MIPFLGAFGKSSAFQFIHNLQIRRIVFYNYLLWRKSSARLHDRAGNMFDPFYSIKHIGVFLSDRRVVYFAL